MGRLMKKLLLAGLAALALIPASAAARPMTSTDLQSFRRIGTPKVSPDGNWVVYQVREADIAANRGRTDLWLLDLRRPGAEAVKIGSTPEHNEHDPSFSADGRSIYFLSGASGSEQLWRVAVTGGQAEQVTNLATDIGGYLLAPSGDWIAIWADRNMACADFNCANVPAAQQGRGSARTYDETFVRHWDVWTEPGVRSRIFTMPMVNGRPQGPGTPVAPNLVGDSPSKPFGGAEELSWSADGRTLFFTLREAGRIEPTSTNLDIFAVPADGSGPPVNLTDANEATDTTPAVSPDGRWLAYAAMRVPTYEADRLVLMLRDLRTGQTRALTQNWDRSVGSIAWAPDGRSLLVTAQDVLDHPAFRIDVRTGRVTRLTQQGTVNNVSQTRSGALVYALNSLTAPDDIYVQRGSRVQQATRVNAALLAQLDRPNVERFSFNGAGGDRVWGQIVRPARGERLPVAFLIHGGPQGSFGNSWSYRWNPWLFSAPGYASVSIDFHGSTGYGQAFTDAINRNWGGAPLEDLRLGLAAAGRQDRRIDTTNACALGGSYGGYMVNWIAGQWPEGFRCLVSHAGVFDLRAMSYETEELWFTEYEFGGPYYEPAAAEVMERWNPVRYVQNWRTPMLVIHGEKDFRIPYSQSLAMFNALQRRNVPSRLVMFPDENHWILKPQNSIQWYREVHGWMAQHLRPAGGQ
jgi:dipeptidyl aminopeptidase/acylaminoacyl peptidase